LALGAVYLGLQYLPEWLIAPYEGLLLSISPIVIILEGLASMVIIVTSGQGLSQFLEDRSGAFQFFFGIVCVILYAASSMVVFSLYYSGQIHLLSTASLVAVALTLVTVLSVATVMLEHGIITDAALTFLYITYNIWALTRDQHTVHLGEERRNLIAFFSSSAASLTESSLLSLLRSMFGMFSAELLTTFFIQLSVFLMASKIVDNSEDPDEVKAVNGSPLREFFLNVLWPCFGKAALVLIYTYAWLIHGGTTKLAWYIEPSFWRWINVFFCLTIYLKHLLTPPDDEYAPVWSHGD
jgi:hypothetical protein